jgi:hypothetical protein
MAYCTISDVKSYLDIDSDADNTLIGELVEASQQMIDQFTRRTFEAEADTTRYFDYSEECIDGYDLLLDADLCDITTVTNGDSVVVASGERTTLPRNDTPYYAIRLLSDSGVVWTYDDEWMDAISVVGKWAYSETAPNDVKRAAVRMASYMYRQKDAQMYDVTAVEAGVVVKPLGIPLDVRMILKPYVRYV